MSNNILEEIRKEQVLNATKKLIVEKGYNNFSMKDIASELDMTTGMIYHYFENKEELFLNVLKSSFFNSYRRVMETVAPLDNFVDKLSAYFDNVSDSQITNIDFWILLINYLGQVQYVPEIKHILRSFMENIRKFIDGIFREGIDQGIIDRGTCEGLPEIIAGISIGMAFQHIIDPESIDLLGAMAKQKEIILHYLISRNPGDPSTDNSVK